MSIDVHVRQVFGRLFLGSEQQRLEYQDIQNIARLIYPENPGIVDALI